VYYEEGKTKTKTWKTKLTALSRQRSRVEDHQTFLLEDSFAVKVLDGSRWIDVDQRHEGQKSDADKHDDDDDDDNDEERCGSKGRKRLDNLLPDDRK
jgi:hypothetical protein